MDKKFLDAIQNTFNTTSLPIEVWATLAFVAISVATAVIWARHANRKRRRERAGAAPSDWIIDKDSVRATLSEAVQQRAKLEIRFAQSGVTSRFMSAGLASVGPDAIDLELSGHISPKTSWAGRKVEVFFRIRPPEKKTGLVFYGFTSAINRVAKTSQGLPLLTLGLPERLEARQKRASLRLDPPPHLIPGLLIYEGGGEITGGGATTHADELARPLLAMKEGGPGRIQVLNISAGGIRLKFSSEAMRDIGPRHFSQGRRYLMRIDLLDPSTLYQVSHYVAAIVQNAAEDYLTRQKESGLAFTHHAATGKEDPRELTWSELAGDQGVEAIDNWVFKRHLELYRNKGLA